MTEAHSDRFSEAWPPGHFYSVLPSLEDIQKGAIRNDHASSPLTVTGIDARDDAQRELLGAFSALAREFPYVDGAVGLRYEPANKMFITGDALILFCFLRHFVPSRVIEVGSGFSSAVMLDTNDRFLQRSLDLTFIEPNPDRLMRLLRDDDRQECTVHTSLVQTVDRDVFDLLEPGDLLFIDSSHVGKTGSDLLFVLFEILPRLPAGCFVHFHDIFWPFEYPLKWYLEGRAWNEAYFLRALLSGTSQYEIVFHNHYMATVNQDAMRAQLPSYMHSGGSSLYLRKT